MVKSIQRCAQWRGIRGAPRCGLHRRRLTRALAARPLVLPIHGPAYHAVAALLANDAAALAATTIDALVLFGASRRDAERASAGLLETVASNIDALGLPLALTGPIVRGDAAAVRRHRIEHPWPWLLKRSFAIDITECPKCTGRMRIIEVAKDEDHAACVLSELGISVRAPPPRALSRGCDPRQLSLSFAG